MESKTLARLMLCIISILTVCSIYGVKSSNKHDTYIDTTTTVLTTSEPTTLVCTTESEPTTEFEPFFQLSEDERRIVECVVMGEARGESYEGQQMVAYCILNACLKDDIQPSQVRTKYQYFGWCSNPSESVKQAVESVFDLGYKPIDEPILYFYAPKYCNSEWHETQDYVTTVGSHRFFTSHNTDWS